MIGYNREEIEKMSVIDPGVYEPVQPTTPVRDIIQVTSFVAEGLGFMDIVENMKKTPRTVMRLFLDIPSLPRPKDFDKYVNQQL